MQIYRSIDAPLTPGSDVINVTLHYAIGILAFGACCAAGWYCGDWLFEFLKRRKE